MKLRHVAVVGSLRRMTNPATKTTTTTAAKAKVVPIKQATKGKAAKAKATTTKATATKATKATTPAPAVETPAKPKFDTTSDATELIVLKDAADVAVKAFETFVCDLIGKGVSPTHIGNAIGLGNSSVRRIAMRHGLDVK